MRGVISIMLALTASPLAAQQVIVSAEPETVSLTVYRAQYRGTGKIDKNWPQGTALITETRTINIPAGDSVIRFEGVSEGMFPESAIVSGLPEGVEEKNRDARLLSPSGLVDSYLKRQVTLTRTDKATGAVREQEAMITAGPNGGVILQTAEGYEALRCTGLPERMSYGGVPENLSAKPTLSVLTHSDAAVSVKVTLTYMASGFDWEANYVAQLQERGADGKGKVDLFAWLTLANGGNQSFLNANTMAIAGNPNRVGRKEQPRPTGGPLIIQCWPAQRTHQVPFRDYDRAEDMMDYAFAPPPPPPSPVSAPPAMEQIMVTGARMKAVMPTAAIVAEQENIGDLKLYRVPEPVTVNAKGQKQVAMLVKPRADFDVYYGATISYYGQMASQPMGVMLRGENLKEKGLGSPMPSGQVMIFEDSSYGPLLTGQTTLTDKAVGEKVKLRVTNSPDVRITAVPMAEVKGKQSWKVDISNARNEAVNAEVEIPFELLGKPKSISRIDGIPTWKGQIPANGEASFSFEVELDN